VTASPSTAAHLADLDARYDAHLAALRRHAAQLQTSVARDLAELSDQAQPDELAADAVRNSEPSS
jgi:LmbE family N-acetylglucosaminyl deacetylase